MTQEWRIRRKQGACALCERGFEEGERMRSLLCIEEAQLARRDVCESCRAAVPDEALLAERVRAALAAGPPAKAGEADAPPAPFALYWWSTRQRGLAQRKVQLDIDLIERLFLELAERTEEPLRELRYLLCLLLMRKRRLKLDGVRRGDGGEALLVHRPRRTERLVVHVHDFGPERMDELRARLEALLEGVEPGSAVEEPRDEGADQRSGEVADQRRDEVAEERSDDAPGAPPAEPQGGAQTGEEPSPTADGKRARRGARR